MIPDGPPCEKWKIGLRCSQCRTNYDFSKYGTKAVGFRFYSVQRDAIVATDVCIIDRKVFNLQWAFSQHACVSFEGFAESWNDAFGLTYVHHDLDRRVFVKSLWWGELEEELRDLELTRYRFSCDADMDVCMKMIDRKRYKKTLYPHSEEDCSPICKARGCGKLWVTDGIWKLQFSHCMFRKANVVNGLPLLNFPNVCTEQPMPGAALCADHCKVVEENGVPTGLRSFLKYAGLTGDTQNADAEVSLAEVKDTDVSKEASTQSAQQIDQVLTPISIETKQF